MVPVVALKFKSLPAIRIACLVVTGPGHLPFCCKADVDDAVALDGACADASPPLKANAAIPIHVANRNADGQYRI